MEKETASSLHAARAAQREFTIHSDNKYVVTARSERTRAMQMLFSKLQAEKRWIIS
jgi:hypothetical protein